MLDWTSHYARRAAGMAGSDVSELLALLSRPDIVSRRKWRPPRRSAHVPFIALRRDAMLRALGTHMPDGVVWTKPEGDFLSG